MSLYTKYRPQSFSHLVGQDLVRETLLNEIKNGTLTHAYLFCGPRGTGKTSTARLIAKALNCTNKNEAGEACDECNICVSIRDGSLIDVLEIDAASNRGIDEIRDLKSKIDYAPSLAKNKIYIIDEVHMLTKEAFNALLKTLEEPPANVYFILCTTEAHKILETIISRCQRFDLKRIDYKTIMARLAFIAQSEGVEADPAAIEMIARHVEGGMRDAIGLFEQLILDKKLTLEHVRGHLGVTGHVTVKKLIDFFVAKDAKAAITTINEIHSEGYDLTTLTREVLEYMREQMIASVHAADAKTAQWIGMIEHVEKARDMLKTTIIPQLPLEIAAIKICIPMQPTAALPPAPVPQNAFQSAAPSTSNQTFSQSASAPVQTAPRAFTPTAAAPATPSPFPSFKPNATLQATQEEAATVTAISQEMVKLSGTVTEHWLRIIEHISPPSLRRSLCQCSLVETETELKMVFRAKFHMEKINVPSVKSAVERAIKDLFGKLVRINCELVVGMAMPQPMSPARQNAPTPQREPEPTPPPSAATNVADKALEMFNEW